MTDRLERELKLLSENLVAKTQTYTIQIDWYSMSMTDVEKIENLLDEYPFITGIQLTSVTATHACFLRLLRKLKKRHVLILGLVNTSITKHCADEIAELIRLTPIIALELNNNEGIMGKGMKRILKALPTSQITSLALLGNSLYGNMDVLVDVLTKHKTKIQRLDLRYMHPISSQFSDLLDAILKTDIAYLNFSCMWLSRESLSRVADMVCHSDSKVKELKIGGNIINDETGVVAVTRMITGGKLHGLFFNALNLTTDDMYRIAGAMRSNRTISSLGMMAPNNMNSEMMTTFMDKMGWHPTLTQLRLFGAEAANECKNIAGRRIDRVHNKRARTLVTLIATKLYRPAFCRSGFVTLSMDILRCLTYML